MSKQPEALRLADRLLDNVQNMNHADVAAELRSLHAINAELVEALRAVDVLFGHLAKDSTQKIWIDNARAAIAKAEGREA